MRTSIALLVATAGIAVAQPRAHAHVHARAHVHRHALAHAKREVVEVHESITVVECWLGDHILAESECKQGIANGTLRWADDGSLSVNTAMTSVHTVSLPAPTIDAPKPAVDSSPKIQSMADPSPAPAPAPAPVPEAPKPKPAVASPAAANKIVQSGSSVGSSNAAFVDRTFPDGQIDCNEFPSQYGAIRTDWLGLNGWVGVQKAHVDGAAGYDDIMTITKAQCDGDNCCVNDSFCSYACPEGYLKWQWPSKQGATGQSVGGLKCQNGKLFLTNPSQPTLCAQGTTNVNVFVQNKMSQNVAVCRTNYPGDEKMSIPVDAQPGTTRKLACPDSSSFFHWKGLPTSAQYYVNMPGYSVEKSCVWGKDGDDFGNYAPANLGVGYSNGRAWVSIQANLPTQPSVKLPYTIELVGDNLSDKCRYQNGQYCNNGGCNSQGCTVSAASGNIYYVMSD